jgi:hypothetical protein
MIACGDICGSFVLVGGVGFPVTLVRLTCFLTGGLTGLAV